MRLRFIQSAEPMKYSVRPRLWKQYMRWCSRKRPTMDTTRTCAKASEVEHAHIPKIANCKVSCIQRLENVDATMSNGPPHLRKLPMCILYRPH